MDFLFFMLLFFSPRSVLSQEDVCTGVICPQFHDCLGGACVCQNPACLPPPVIVAIPPAAVTTAAVDVCASSPCRNGCECVTSCKHENGYYCEGPDGYMGKNCEMAAPLLTCAANEISISVEASLLNSFYKGSKEDICVYVGPTAGERPEDEEACKVCTETDGNYTISLLLPFLNCNTSAFVADDGQIIFTNMIWTDIQSIDYSMPKPVVNFQCTYAQEYSMVTSIKPTLESNKPFLQGLVQLQAAIELCKSGNSCPAACPPMYSVANGAVYTISEHIHVIFSVQSSPSSLASRRLVLQELYLSCSSDVDTPQNENVYLVVGGCETFVLTTSIDRARSTNSVICTSFRIPRMLQCNVFYIHARLRIADDTNLPICPGPIRKVRRSDEDSDLLTVQSGPIFIIEGSEGHPDSSLVLTGDNELLEDVKPVWHSGNKLFVLIAITGSVVLVLLIAAVVFVQFYR